MEASESKRRIKGKPVVKTDKNSPASELARLMDEYNVGSVIIMDRGEPAGIVTDRDIAIVLGTSGRGPDEILAGDVMRSPITTVPAGASLMEVVRQMTEHNVRRLPVVDDGELVDIITLDDIIRLISETLRNLEGIIEAESPQNIVDAMDD